MTDNDFMKIALREAQKAYDMDEVPIGAVIVAGNTVIAKGYNQTQLLCDSTAHAEIIALTSAFEYLQSKYLPECTMYITLEPCAMCAGAIRWAQLARIVYGAPEPKCGFSLYSPSILHPKTEVLGGIEAELAAEIMRDFFSKKRT